MRPVIASSYKDNTVTVTIDDRKFRFYRKVDGTFGIPKSSAPKNKAPANIFEGSQKDRILTLLCKHADEWVPLWKIMDLKPRIACHHKRIIELRQLGYDIENRKMTFPGGKGKRQVVHSEYRLNS